MQFSVVSTIFVLLTAVFLFLTFIDYQKHGSKTTPARKAWLRIGLIFAVVSIYLFFFQGRLR